MVAVMFHWEGLWAVGGDKSTALRFKWGRVWESTGRVKEGSMLPPEQAKGKRMAKRVTICLNIHALFVLKHR